MGAWKDKSGVWGFILKGETSMANTWTNVPDVTPEDKHSEDQQYETPPDFTLEELLEYALDLLHDSDYSTKSIVETLIEELQRFRK